MTNTRPKHQGIGWTLLRILIWTAAAFLALFTIIGAVSTFTGPAEQRTVGIVMIIVFAVITLLFAWLALTLRPRGGKADPPIRPAAQQTPVPAPATTPPLNPAVAPTLSSSEIPQHPVEHQLSRRELRERDQSASVVPSNTAAPSPAASPTPPASAPASRNGRAKKAQQTPIVYPLLTTSTWYGQEISGESHHIKEITRITGKPRLNEETEVETIGALVPEPRNKYDHNAVRLEVNGQLLGYLPKEDAPAYSPVLQALTAAGFLPQVGVRIWAVTRKDWDTNRLTQYANVRINLDAPELLIPVNDPPTEPYALLPIGSSLQVTGEEAHLDLLAPLISHSGESRAIGTLHVDTYQLKNGDNRERVEVRINGTGIGVLTPQTSKHFLPTIRHLEERGLIAAAIIVLKGSPIDVQASVKAAKASEIPVEWFTSEPLTLPAIGK